LFKKKRNYTKLILFLLLPLAALAIAAPFIIQKMLQQSQASTEKEEIKVVETELPVEPISLGETYFAFRIQNDELLKIQSETVAANQDIFYVINFLNGAAGDRIEIENYYNGEFRGITSFRPAAATGTRKVLVSQADQNTEDGEIRVIVSVNQKIEKDMLLFLSFNNKDEVKYINYNSQAAGLSFEYPEFLLPNESTPGTITFNDIKSDKTFLNITLINYDGTLNPDGLLDWYLENKTKQNYSNISPKYRSHYSIGPLTGAEMELNASTEKEPVTLILFAFNTTSYYVVFDFQVSENPVAEEIDTVKNILNNIIVSTTQ